MMFFTITQSSYWGTRWAPNQSSICPARMERGLKDSKLKYWLVPGVEERRYQSPLTPSRLPTSPLSESQTRARCLRLHSWPENGNPGLVGPPLPAKRYQVLTLTLDKKGNPNVNPFKHFSNHSEPFPQSLCSTSQQAACSVKITHMEIPFCLFHKSGLMPATSSWKKITFTILKIGGRGLQCQLSMAKPEMILYWHFQFFS